MTNNMIGMIVCAGFFAIGVVLLLYALLKARKKSERIFMMVIGAFDIMFSIIAIINIIPLAIESNSLNTSLQTIFADAVLHNEPPKGFQSGGDKMVIYDTEISKFDTFLIPSDFKAKKSEDVEIVILLEKEKLKAGTYTNGAAAYIWEYKLRFFDAETWIMLNEESVRGSSPPKATTVGMGTTGKPPSDEDLREVIGNFGNAYHQWIDKITVLFDETYAELVGINNKADLEAEHTRLANEFYEKRYDQYNEYRIEDISIIFSDGTFLYDNRISILHGYEIHVAISQSAINSEGQTIIIPLDNTTPIMEGFPTLTPASISISKYISNIDGVDSVLCIIFGCPYTWD